MADEPGIQHVELSPDKWKHRLIVKEAAPEGTLFAGNHYDAMLNHGCHLMVWGEKREGYFLVEADVVNEGKAAVLTFDLYDLS